MKYTEEEWSKLNNVSKGRNEVELLKQEISDEEIEKGAANLANPNVDKTDNWIEGAKWYREQLKQRQ
jgi:hypothetical protein